MASGILRKPGSHCNGGMRGAESLDWIPPSSTFTGMDAEPEAFWELHRAEAFRIALLMTGRRELAEEALQETWLGFSEGLDSFDPAQGSTRTWFLGILRNKVLRLLRSERRRAQPLDLSEEEEPEIPAGEAPDATLIRREERTALLRALASLDEASREAVAGRWILGWSDMELAEALGLEVDAARKRANRGLLALRAAMISSKNR